MVFQEKLGANARVASFDVFDTLVTRVCGSPRKVFDCVEHRAIALGFDAEGFAEERVSAEAAAIDAVGESKLKLEDIYSCFRGSRFEGVRDKLMEIEIEAEVNLCVPIPEGVAVFRRCLESCDTVVVVSDMYLPERVVSRILDKCGIEGYAKLFVSCEYGETKADGSLYERAVSELGVRPDQITHFGDNLHSDVLSARKNGLRSCAMVCGKETALTKVMFQKLANRIMPHNSASYSLSFPPSGSDGMLIDEIGYNVFGPLLVSFCEWVHERKEAHGFDGLWFAARDGWVMKRCYDLLYPDEHTEYLLVSRRSTTVPMLVKNPGISGFVKTVGLGREMSVDEILMRLGLSDDQASRLESAYGFQPDERLVVSDLDKNPRFLALYRESESLILNNASDELEAMNSYLNRSFGDAQSIGLVDLGWRGSIQHAIESALPEIGLEEMKVTGLYLGIDVDSAWWGHQLMEGFLYSPMENIELGTSERWFNALVEAFFMAPHGTVRRYLFSKDGSAKAELEDREAGNEDSSPLFLVQEAALRFARDYKERRWDEYGILDKAGVVQAFYRLGLEPAFKEACELGDCIFAYQEVSNLARPKHGLGYYIVHPKELVREMNVCYWKPAFLRRVLNLPIQYWKALSAVKSIVN